MPIVAATTARLGRGPMPPDGCGPRPADPGGRWVGASPEGGCRSVASFFGHGAGWRTMAQYSSGPQPVPPCWLARASAAVSGRGVGFVRAKTAGGRYERGQLGGWGWVQPAGCSGPHRDGGPVGSQPAGRLAGRLSAPPIIRCGNRCKNRTQGERTFGQEHQPEHRRPLLRISHGNSRADVQEQRENNVRLSLKNRELTGSRVKPAPSSIRAGRSGGAG
jgi:hypothetical protein